MAKRIEWVKGKRRNYENSLADIIGSTIKPLLDKNSKIEADLILSWQKIFDKQMAGKITFGKINFTDKKANRFTLHVTTSGKDMLEITHATEIIKEQLNMFLGYSACERVVVSRR